MKLLYDLRIIDLPRSQWNHAQPWPVRIAWALWGLWLAIVSIVSRVFTRTRQTIRVVAETGQLAARIIIDDLAFRAGRALLGDRLAGTLYPA